jgi:fibronectin type 3 domain-containing protein
MTMRLKKSRRPIDLGCDALVELLEGRQLLSGTPQLSVTTSAVNNAVAFNTVAQGNSGAAPSRIETATITDTGTAPLTFAGGAFSIINDPSTTAAASDFAITNSGSLPSSLAPGSSFTIDLQYTATAVGLQSALLQIQSNDPANPTFDVNLHGIGTAGQFGTLEPSLVQVLLAQNIPTIVGAGPNDANVNTQAYPINPDASSQEVPMQRLVVATAGQPVTITPLASFSSATSAVSRIGYYTPGNPSSLNEAFYIGQGDAQTVDPTALGATSFNPGSAPFGLYGTFPGTTIPSGQLDIHYSEDVLNAGSTDGLRKIRFFPMETASGTVVPNSYVFAIEDYDSSAYNSFINFVGIISNVQPAANATAGSVPSNATANNPPVMGINLNQTSPGSTTLVFNDLTVADPVAADVVHNNQAITIKNTGDQPLVLNSLTLSDTTNWALFNPPAPGTSIAAGSSLNVTIQFIANSDPAHTGNETNDTQSVSSVPSDQAGGVWNGTLTINSNDPVNPVQTVNLAGYWQYQSEHENEPGFHTLTDLLWGYGINDSGSTSTNGTEFPNNGNTPVLYGSEVDPSTDQGLLVAADPTQSVSMVELAAFHSQYATPKAYVSANGNVQEVDIYSISESGSTVTVATDTAENFQVGQTVNIESVGPLGYDGAFTITSAPNGVTFTYTDTAGLGPTTPFAAQAQSGWYPQGQFSNLLFKDAQNNGQSVYPNLLPDSYSTVQNSFNPTGAFGINLDGQFSQDSLNSQDLQYNTSPHALRFFPVTQANGDIVPNTWIVGLDYRNYVGPNSDYQDLFMLLTNATFEGMPPTPIDLQATRGTSGVNLQWTPMSGAVSYNVLASVNGGAFAQVNGSPITSSSFVDTTEPSGANVQYEVTSINSSGVASVPGIASINLGSTVTPPAAPAIEQTDGSSGTQVSLSWSAPAGATAYNLQREDPGQSTFVTIASGLTSTSYVDTNVTLGSTYQYEVQATNAGGSSPFSSSVGVFVGAVQTAPLAPTISQADGSSGTEVDLAWSTSSGADSYQIQREGPGQNSFATIATGLTGTSFTDTSVTPGATYIYTVIAVNSSGSSSPSAPVSATVAPPQSPLTVTVGRGALSFLKFVTAANTRVTISITGPGTLTVDLAGGTLSSSPSGKGAIVTGTNTTIVDITTNGTTAASSILISTTGGNKTVSIGAISSGTALNSILAPTASLIGPLTVAGTIKRVNLGSAVAATMTVGGNLSNFHANTINGASLVVTGNIGILVVGNWTSNQAISAASISSINITGNAELNVTAGTLRSLHVGKTLQNSTLILSDAGVRDLTTLSAATIQSSQIDAAGNIGTITASVLDDSQIYAGTGANGPMAFPPIGTAFPATASIANITLRTRKGVFSDIGSDIAASQIQNLNLGNIQFNNGGTPFGVQALSIKMLSGSNPSVRPFIFRNLTSAAIVSADFSAKQITPEDFTVAFMSQYSGS